MAEFEPLTVEASAAIGAFMQQLAIQAEGGQPVDEETLALRMLASVNADPDSDLSGIRPLNAGAVPVTAAANGNEGNDKFDELVKIMTGDTTPPADQIAKGQVPKPPAITLLPGYSNDDVLSNYATLDDASSMIQLYSNLMQVQQKPEGFDITTQAGEAFNFQAKTAYDAMMGPMAGFYNFGAGTTQTYNDTIPKGDVHANLLGKVFNGFGFDNDTMNALDGQLTNFVGGLANIHTDNNPENTMDFCLRFGLCPRKNVTGDDANPIWAYQPTTFLLYMKIDAQSFRQSVGKDGSIDEVNFKFSLTVVKCELNVKQFEKNRAKFDKIFELVTNKNLRQYSQLLNQQIKTNEPNPGANFKQ